MLKRLLTLAQKLDNAGLTKEADLADKIAQMDEWDDTEGDWNSFDSMEGAGEGEIQMMEGADSDPFGEEDSGAVQELVSQLDAMKGMLEEGLVDEEQLAEVQSQVESMMSLFLGGGPSMITGEEPQPASGFGGTMELGSDGIEPGQIPVAEAKRRRGGLVRSAQMQSVEAVEIAGIVAKALMQRGFSAESHGQHVQASSQSGGSYMISVERVSGNN